MLNTKSVTKSNLTIFGFCHGNKKIMNIREITQMQKKKKSYLSWISMCWYTHKKNTGALLNPKPLLPSSCSTHFAISACSLAIVPKSQLQSFGIIIDVDEGETTKQNTSILRVRKQSFSIFSRRWRQHQELTAKPRKPGATFWPNKFHTQ